MANTRGRAAGQRAAVPLTWALGVAVGVTAAVVLVPFLGFAYRAPALHVALETANALVALLVAYLVYGRYRERRGVQELLLVLAMCTVAVANLALSALPFAVAIGRDQDSSRWAALAIRFLGTLLLVTAALTPAGRRVTRRGAGWIVLALSAVVVTVALLGIVYGTRLPPTIDVPFPAGDVARPLLAGHPVVLAVQALGAVLYAVAAVAFTRQSERSHDELMRWVGAGCVLASAARVHYLLFPSLYSDYVYSGDLLRLGFYLLLLVGAAREIGSYWQARTRAAVLEDRRRMAMDLHDGLTQELSYIRAQSQRLAARPGDVAVVHQIGTAAGRATEEARRAISALTRPVGEPFPAALQRQLDQAAHRHDLTVLTDLDQAVEVDPAQDEALLRIVSEAVHNAVRHGAASRIAVRLTADPPRLVVHDDGRGFAPGMARGAGFGLTSMRERAQGIGGSFAVTSAPDEGTTVQVTWP